jgi:hypothetical protein
MYIIIFSLQFKSRLSASIHFYPYLLFIQSLKTALLEARSFSRKLKALSVFYLSARGMMPHRF